MGWEDEVTPAPITPVPLTPAPVTPAPVTPAPVTPAPVTPAPVTPAPVVTTPAPVPVSSDPCCPPNYSGLKAHTDCTKWHHCQNGNVIGPIYDCPDGTGFRQDVQACDWLVYEHPCEVLSCDGETTPPPTSSSDPCCPAGFAGLKAHNDCKQWHYCENGNVVLPVYDCPGGTGF